MIVIIKTDFISSAPKGICWMCKKQIRAATVGVIITMDDDGNRTTLQFHGGRDGCAVQWKKKHAGRILDPRNAISEGAIL